MDVTPWVPLAKRIALYMARDRPRYVDRDDVVGWAMLGLVDAGRKFDPTLGVPFEMYAGRRIKGAVLDGFREMDWLTVRQRQANPDVPPPLSLSSERDEEYGFDVDRVTPDRFEDGTVDRVTIQAVLGVLSGRDQRILVERVVYGRTQEDVGAEFGVTGSRVNQIVSRAARLLREELAS